MPVVLRQNWWALAIRGCAAILFAILTFIAPGVSVAVLVFWFGAYAFIDGIFSIVAAWHAPDAHSRWGSLLLEGIVGIAIGVVSFLWPIITAAALVYLIAAWAIITGAFEIAAAVRLRRVISNEWLLIALGVVSVIFGFLLVMTPVIGALVIAFWIGAYALIFGVLMLALAFRMRNWQRSHATGPVYGAA